MEILATKCINNGAPTTFYIYTHGLNDKMRITVQTNCSCSCSKVARQINTPQCSNHGTYECGVCTCAKGYYGRECECDTASPSIESKIQQCKKWVFNSAHTLVRAGLLSRPGSSEICSGRGQCVCGQCKCETATIQVRQAQRFRWFQWPCAFSVGSTNQWWILWMRWFLMSKKERSRLFGLVERRSS